MKEICLANLADSTTQEVFDFVARHLLTQGAKALSDKSCVYRAKDGKKCAAGCLITEKEYSSAFENKPWEQLVKAEMVPSAHEQLIYDLQTIHDIDRVAIWEDSLQNLAKTDSLQYSPEKYKLNPSI